MDEREKVIKELSWIVFNFPLQENPKDEADRMCNAVNTYCNNALALLREQEPRVLPWEKVDKSGNSYVWAEIRSFYTDGKALIYCTIVNSDFFEYLYRLREDSSIEWVRTKEDYNRDDSQGSHSGWRCWTARPTEEQMRDTPWEGGEERGKIQSR